MAIAKMKKLTLLAEQENKDDLLKTIQELQNIEITPLNELIAESEQDVFSFLEVDDAHSSLEEKLQDIEHSLSFLNQYVPSPGMITQLKQKREVFTLNELEDHVESLDVEQIIKKIEHKERHLLQLEEELNDLKKKESFFRKWRNLPFLPSEVKDFQMLSVQVGTIDQEQSTDFEKKLDEYGTIYYESIFNRSDEVGYVIVLPKSDKSKLKETASGTSYSELNYEYNRLPEDALYDNLSKQEKLRETEFSEKEEMKDWKATVRDLQLAEEYIHNVKERETAKTLVANSKHLFLASGWIEEEKVSSLTKSVDETFGTETIAILTDNIEIEDITSVPIVLKNSKFIQPFETVTEMYGLPQYNGIDPTPLLMPFQLIFFGMMSADLGYGLLLFIATLIGLKGFNLSGSIKKNIQFFHLLSYGTMAFGLLFGSLFGMDLPFQLLSLSEDTITVMIISIILGVVQILFGLILGGIVNTKQKQKAAAYIDGYAWAMVLLGICIWLIGDMLLDINLLAQAGIWLAILNVVGILIVSTFASENKAAGFAGGLYNLYGISGYVGDIVSYVRLMALAVASANIAIAFNMIISFMPPFLRFTVGIVLLLALHGLNIFLAFLGAYVHTMRLQYVEFFGKFYEGGGKKFTPLKSLEKYIWIKEKN